MTAAVSQAAAGIASHNPRPARWLTETKKWGRIQEGPAPREGAIEKGRGSLDRLATGSPLEARHPGCPPADRPMMTTAQSRTSQRGCRRGLERLGAPHRTREHYPRAAGRRVLPGKKRTSPCQGSVICPRGCGRLQIDGARTCPSGARKRGFEAQACGQVRGLPARHQGLPASSAELFPLQALFGRRRRRRRLRWLRRRSVSSSSGFASAARRRRSCHASTTSRPAPSPGTGARRARRHPRTPRTGRRAAR